MVVVEMIRKYMSVFMKPFSWKNIKEIIKSNKIAIFNFQINSHIVYIKSLHPNKCLDKMVPVLDEFHI